MKIIGEAKRDHCVAIVSKDEIEKVFNKFYGGMPAIKIGDIIDLAQGYDFGREIQQVCSSMRDSMESFDRARATLQQFALMVAENAPSEGEHG